MTGQKEKNSEKEMSGAEKLQQKNNQTTFLFGGWFLFRHMSFDFDDTVFVLLKKT